MSLGVLGWLVLWDVLDIFGRLWVFWVYECFGAIVVFKVIMGVVMVIFVPKLWENPGIDKFDPNGI